MAIINNPPSTAVDNSNATDEKGQKAITAVNTEWRNFFQAVFIVCSSVTMSGTTANRPTKMLWTGRPYFDTSLGIPIWYKTAGWVNSAGVAV